MDKNEAGQECAVDFAEVELAIDRLRRALCKLAKSQHKVQQASAECDSVPLHATRFMTMQALTDEAHGHLGALTISVHGAHLEGDKIANDGGIIVTGGGGK